MRTFEDCKKEIAVNSGYKNFDEIIEQHNYTICDINLEVYINKAAELYAKAYAIEMCRQQRELCAENAESEIIKFKLLNGVRNATYAVIDKESILNIPLPNELKE